MPSTPLRPRVRAASAGAAAAVLAFLAAPARAQAPDPAASGPHAVTTVEYTQGDTAFTPAGFPGPVEFTGVVFHPTDLGNGPYPLVLYLHGRHAVCTGTFTWPCPAGQQPIRSYRGYDYSGQQLASHGYIVISISANGINARDNGVNDLGAAARAELVDRHLQFWRTLNTSGAAPFGTQFVGRVDLARVGTMGHSRGGEGVMRHFSFNAGRPAPFPLAVIVPIAPTNFSRWQVNQGIAVAQLLPYCDGDVSDLQGVHYYDDARYRMSAGGYQGYVTVMGANHNFFNTVWTPGLGPGASDDWSLTGDPHCGTGAGSGRLSAAQQRAVGQAYLAAFFRTEVGGEDGFLGYIDGTLGQPPTVASLDLHTSFHGHEGQRRDLNRLLAAADLTTNALGGASNQMGLTPHDLCGGPSPQPQHCLAGQATSRQPHTTPSARSTLRGMSSLRTGWSAPGGTYDNQIPAGPPRDLSGFDVLQFRASVNFADARNGGGAQDFSVRFGDAAGGSQTLRVGQFSDALFFPPGAQGAVPKVLQNTVRLPLSSLTAIDRTQVSEVAFLFGSSGALLLSDIHFYRSDATPPAPSFTLTATPSERAVPPGGSTTYTAVVTSVSGFSGTVDLSVTGLPMGSGAVFSPASITGGSGASTLTVTTASATPAGRYTLALTGTSGSLQRTALAALDVVVPSSTVFFDDFEADLGWVRNPGGTDTAASGLWERGDPQATSSGGVALQNGTAASGANDLVTARLAGTAAGTNDVDGGTTSIQSPPISLPAGGQLTLSFAWYLAHLNNATTADFLRVSIVSGTGTTQVFQQLGAASNRAGTFATATVNLTPFAGQTVRILVQAADAGTASLIEAAVDDVRVTRN
jgi:hypothetical protein